jgi:hypothetical protein
MTDSDDVRPSRGILSWLRRIFRPQRPDRPTRPERDLSAETHRVQVDVIRRAFDGQVAVATKEDGAEVEYLYRPGVVLVRSHEREDLDNFFNERLEIYRGPGDVVDDRVDGLFVYQLPRRANGDHSEVLETLEQIDRELREGLATPDHVLYVTTGGVGRMCPATEPEIPATIGVIPPMSQDLSAGRDIKVSVVDTGWWGAAAQNKVTDYLKDVNGDAEQINQAAIHEYAGHGTFVSGIIKCLAPATTIEVEGFLTHGGAAYESEITAQLNEAMVENNSHLISISAGTHTRNDLGLLGFQVLGTLLKWADADSAVLVVAAAGNDSSNKPFWPAAFDWVVSVGSLDADGKVSDFSNYGPWVDVFAQGRNLVNAFPTGTYTTYEPQTPAGQVRKFTTGLAQWSGTSFSTPVVTGAIAAYKTRNNKTSVRAAYAEMLTAAKAKSRTDPKYGTVTALGPPFM